MRQTKDEPSWTAASSHAIDLISAVKELNRLSSQELSKLLRDSENFTIHYLAGEEILIKIDVERLAAFLPLHLMAVLISSDRNEALFRYLLCGIRLLHSLCELAPRHSKLEQILLDDVKVSEQLIDLLFYLLIVLGGYRKENHKFGSMSILHSALVACSLYLLMGCISAQWPDVVHVLLAHPKVDIFIDAAFRAVHEDVRFLEIKLSAHDMDTSLTSEEIVNYLCLQCEASLQFLQTLCQQKVFRERLLRNKASMITSPTMLGCLEDSLKSFPLYDPSLSFKIPMSSVQDVKLINLLLCSSPYQIILKELCSKGGVLFLARTILKINITRPFLHTSTIVAAVSRLKAKVLSILLSLCEAESISYLDEVASSPRSLDLAKSVALQVLEILNAAFSRDHQTDCSDTNHPMGFLQLNAMRLADIFSDDSNFRAYITNNFTKVLAAIFSLSHGEFLSSWCSSDLPVKEEDATLEYDLYAAAGWIVDSFPTLDMMNSKNLEFALTPNTMPPTSFAHQRTSLFVKIIANLHCFVPSICEEQERNLFLRKFVDCLKMDPMIDLPGYSFTPVTSTAAIVCRNLRSLLSQAQSLIPNFLNEEDVHLLRVFFDQLQKVISSAEIEANQVENHAGEESMSWEKFSKLKIQSINQDDQNAECCVSLSVKEEPHIFSNGNFTEGTSENSAFREVDFSVEIEHLDQSDVGLKKPRSKEESLSGRKTSGGSKEDGRDLQNIETSGSDTNSARGRNSIDQIGCSEILRSLDHVNESEPIKNQKEEKAEVVQCEEKHRRKRKRTIMNDKQMKLIERALLDEPEMQRHAASIQSWADKLSLHGSYVTSSQLKNWLNNRKARLARTAKDIRSTSEIDSVFPDKQVGPGTLGFCDSPDSPAGETYTLTNAKRDQKNMQRAGISDNSESAPMDLLQFKPGQAVVLVDAHGEEVAKAKIYQAHGKWNGQNLDELETIVVDVDDLKAERDTLLPYPSNLTGSSFHEAETMHGVMRILWDSSRIFILQ